MRVCVGAIICLFVAANTVKAVKLELEIGQTFDLIVQTVPHTIDGCYIKTPQEEIIEFKPKDNSDKSKYKLLKDNELTACQVQLKITDSKDNGVWSIYFTEKEKIVKKEEYDVNVKSSDRDEENSIQDTTLLKPIEYIVRKGMTVEISVSRNDDVLACILTTPKQTILLESEEQDGINLFKTNPDLYTSCRVQIGPINDETLLGDWSLCSQRLVADKSIQECQSASIIWSNDNMNSIWSQELQAKFDHPVHFGSDLTLTVKHYGDVKSCHVIPPSGNDLTILEHSKFPYITRIAPFTECNVVIGPIDIQCIGDWTLYGIFTSFSGVSVVTLPTSFYIYNEQNPHDQAYNVSNPEPILKIINTATTVELEVKGKGNVDSCDITPPENTDIENNLISIENNDSCRYAVGPFTDNMLGDWLVTGKFSKNNIYSEIRQVFTIKKEDPYNPDVDSDRIIRYLGSQRFETMLGKTHEVVINGDETLRIIESCHVKIPDGRQYAVIDGFYINGVEVEKGPNCALKITVVSQDMIGEWTLIARKSDLGLPVEERLKFTINIEEQVQAVPSEVTIDEFKDLFMRLQYETQLSDTCKLYSPEGELYQGAEVDPEFKDNCGFIVKNVKESMSGIWNIVYGDGIVYRAVIAVNVINKNANGYPNFPDRKWSLDHNIDINIGPEDVTYCQIIDPKGDIAFESYSQCKITISKVTMSHEGRWIVLLGEKGNIFTETYHFYVNVQDMAESKPRVFPLVQFSDQPYPLSVSLYCSVGTSYLMEHVCKFRSPIGEMFIANEGVAQHRYTAIGGGSPVHENEVYEHKCGLRVSDLLETDFGIWACTIASANETFHGFLTVPSMGHATPVPKLISIKDSVKAAVGDEVTMSCSIPAKIEYCYFRNEDGSVYNLVPGVSSDVEYVGAGLDAGECGMKLKSAKLKHSGQWTCNVGRKNTVIYETKTEISLKVYEELILSQYISDKMMLINATVMPHHNYFLDSPQVEYCRYVRSDGYVFISNDVPNVYMSSYVTDKTCILRISQVTAADYYPWTVTMRLRDTTRELTGFTSLNLQYYYYYWNSVALWLWLTITILGVSLIILGFSLGPKKNRDWTIHRARTIRNSIRSSIRASFRGSVRKAPLPLPSIIDDKPPAYSAE